MSVKRRQNWQGQQRVDVPHLKSVESAISHDFDQLISGLVIGEDKSYVVRGLKINMPGSIGSSANGLQLIVEDSAFLHGASDESGTFYTIPTGTPAEILSSTTNERVQGSFTPNTDNYVGIEFIRAVDDTTADQVYFWNPTTNVEITKTVPLAIIQDYKIVISTSSFGSNVLPVAVVQTDASNNVISITDRRPLLYRLGTAGQGEPNPFYTYEWDETRSETFYTSTSSTSDPFYGGDKVISNMKEFFDALMTELKLLKGTPFWYSTSDAGSLYRNRQDLGSTAFTGKGSISHAIAFFNGQVAGMTTDISIKAISLSVTLTADGVKDVNTLISEHNVANESEPVYLVSGDGSQVPTADIVLTSAPGRINWDSDVFLNFIGGRLRYKIKANEDTGHVTLTDNQVAYVKLVRGENIIPNLVFTNGGIIVTSAGNVNWTEDLEAGDFIKDASKGDEFYYEIDSVNSLSQVTLTEAFQEPSSGPGGFDAQYAFGVYETSASPSTDRHIYVVDRGSVPFNENVFWLFFRADDGGAPQVYVRMLGGKELEQGESREISDNTSEAILNYIGAANESDNAPNYTDATGTSITNIHLIDSENLTLGMKRLEHRDDVIPRVRVIDIISTSLPTGASVTIDGQILNNGDYVFFTNPAIEGLYKVSGVGVAIAFEAICAFKGVTTPVDGDLIRVENGTSYFRTVWKRVANEWKPLEVKEATKEPTGFPNRVDSEISFDELTRTFSVGPKAPQTYFDIFIKGKPYRFTTPQTVVVPDNEGIFFFYFETDGSLVYDTSFDLTLITEKVFISTVYWDVTNQKAILVGDERHGITMDAATHEYLHNLNGAVLTSGGDIGFTEYEAPVAASFSGQVAGMSSNVIIDADNTGLAGNVTLVADSVTDIDGLIAAWNIANPSNTLTLSTGDGSQIPTADITLTGGIDGAGDTDDDAQISLNDMILRDEDIVMNIVHSAAPADIFEQILDPIAEIPVYYRNGVNGDWRRDDATQYPVKQGISRIQYNNESGPWTQEDVQEGYYTSMWIFATNNQNEPVITILGQAEHNSLSTAQELDTPQSINLAGIPTVEFKLLYRIIFQSSSTFANTPKAAVVDVRDLRAVEDTAFAQVAPNDHGSLSGLEDPDHPASAINMDGVEKDGGLSEFDDSVGETLTTLNRLLGQLRIKPHPVNGNRVVITGANRILNSGTTLIQEIKNLVIDFEGAEIDFATGQIFKADGVTSLGIDFTPEIIPASEYLNYSITLIPAEVNPNNTISAQLIVLPAAGTNAVKANAPKAPFAQGTKLGQVTVQESGGGIAALDEVSISQLGTGGGGSGSGSGFVKVNYHDPISTTLPTGTSVTIDGQPGVDGDLVLFTNLASGNNKIYRLDGVGVSITWETTIDFNVGTPENGDTVIVLSGDGFREAVGKYNGSSWVFNDTVRYYSGSDYWEQSSLKTSDITPSSTGSIFEVELFGSENMVIDYSVARGVNKETGIFIITSDGTNVNYTRHVANIGDVGVILFADNNAGDLRFRYTSDGSGVGNIKYSVKRWSNTSGGPGGIPSYSGSSGSGGSAAGSNTDVQYNAVGSLAGDSNFQWDSSDSSLKLGNLKTQSMVGNISINDNQASPATLFSFSGASYKFVIVEYSIERGLESRIGRLMICHNGTVATITEDYNDTGGLGIDNIAISISVLYSGGTVFIRYTSNNTGNTGVFKYSLRKWL